MEEHGVQQNKLIVLIEAATRALVELNACLDSSSSESCESSRLSLDMLLSQTSTLSRLSRKRISNGGSNSSDRGDITTVYRDLAIKDCISIPQRIILPAQPSNVWGGFYNKTLRERTDLLELMFPKVLESRKDGVIGALPIKNANLMVENCIGVLGIPLGLGLNFVVDGVPRTIPMAVEEPSVIAAASGAAKLVATAGGFHTAYSGNVMTAQVQVLGLPSSGLEAAAQRVAEGKPRLLAVANGFCQSMRRRGGGVVDLYARVVRATPPGDDGVEAPMGAEHNHNNSSSSSSSSDLLVVHLDVDVCDAMGANVVNTVAEGAAAEIALVAAGGRPGVRPGLRILTNLCVQRRACAWFRLPLRLMGWKRAAGRTVAEKVVEAAAFAEADPFRACTGNKGVMNGVDAAALALGQDWRALEAAAHAFSVRGGRYRPFTTYRIEEELAGEEAAAGEEGGAGAEAVLVGELELPLAVGVRGGALHSHPGYRATHALLGNPDAATLAGILAAVGLAQSFAALRALSVTGIQEGHMGLHARNIATAAGASSALVPEVVAYMSSQRRINKLTAREYLRAHQYALLSFGPAGSLSPPHARGGVESPAAAAAGMLGTASLGPSPSTLFVELPLGKMRGGGAASSSSSSSSNGQGTGGRSGVAGGGGGEGQGQAQEPELGLEELELELEQEQEVEQEQEQELEVERPVKLNVALETIGARGESRSATHLAIMSRQSTDEEVPPLQRALLGHLGLQHLTAMFAVLDRVKLPLLPTPASCHPAPSPGRLSVASESPSPPALFIPGTCSPPPTSSYLLTPPTSPRHGSGPHSPSPSHSPTSSSTLTAAVSAAAATATGGLGTPPPPDAGSPSADGALSIKSKGRAAAAAAATAAAAVVPALTISTASATAASEAAAAAAATATAGRANVRLQDKLKLLSILLNVVAHRVFSLAPSLLQQLVCTRVQALQQQQQQQASGASGEAAGSASILSPAARASFLASVASAPACQQHPHLLLAFPLILSLWQVFEYEVEQHVHNPPLAAALVHEQAVVLARLTQTQPPPPFPSMGEAPPAPPLQVCNKAAAAAVADGESEASVGALRRLADEFMPAHAKRWQATLHMLVDALGLAAVALPPPTMCLLRAAACVVEWEGTVAHDVARWRRDLALRRPNLFLRWVSEAKATGDMPIGAEYESFVEEQLPEFLRLVQRLVLSPHKRDLLYHQQRQEKASRTTLDVHALLGSLAVIHTHYGTLHVAQKHMQTSY